ncbi:MAG: hypothetical protein K8R23_02085 [Chthoniobacter sp.]|nr:hypothetical protein [Chthoniobacter sp.]
MKKSVTRILPLAALILTSGVSANAQEFFRDMGTSRSSGGLGPIYPSEYTYEDSSPSGLSPLRPGQDLNEAQAAEEADRYNFAIGPVQFGLAMGVGIEYNDNITLADSHRISDFVFRPSLDVQATWRISELNTLRLTVGASYAKYFDHSEFDSDGVLLSPNSDLAFTFYLGAVKLTLRDRLSYQEDAYSIAAISNTGDQQYRRYENQVGLQADWAVNEKINLVLGYDHYNLWTVGNGFSQQDRAIDTIFFKPSYQMVPGIKVGVNTSYSFINFDSNDRGDGHGLLVGPFIEWQMSEYTNLYLEAGFQQLQFDKGGDFQNSTIDQLGLSAADAAAVRNVLRDNEDSDSYYIKFEINNKPSDIFDHRLLFSKTAEIGFSSNSYDLYHAEYDANWHVLQHTDISPVIFYEYYTASGDLGEKAHRVGAGLGVRYHFSNSVTLGLDYRFIAKDSNLENSDYRQSLAFLSLYYKF